ncbi:hypothetical protein ACEXQD_05960 [Herbiconiux sp. P15]|uniref:hypothetical protein n=1 Tax=Herbiconiux liukaitaii TaxID=3342799 RepID=UPI0035BA234B
MNLSDQIFITGTVMVLEGIRLRRAPLGDLPLVYVESRIRDAATPELAAKAAREIAAAYRGAAPYAAPDGVDEHWRVATMSEELARRIEGVFGH